jgi:hypothetical protein
VTPAFGLKKDDRSDTEDQVKLSKWKRWLLIGGATVALVLVLIRQAIVHTGPPTKEEWLQQQATRLKNVTVTDEMIAAAKPWDDLSSGQEWYCRIHGEGVIPLANGNWVYAVCHSWHANDFSGKNRPLQATLTWRIRRLRQWLMGDWYQQPVGDAIIAIDQSGRLYTNDGHVCGDLQLVSDKPVATVEDFLLTRTQPKEAAWEPMK